MFEVELPKEEFSIQSVITILPCSRLIAKGSSVDFSQRGGKLGLHPVLQEIELIFDLMQRLLYIYSWSARKLGLCPQYEMSAGRVSAGKAKPPKRLGLIIISANEVL